MAENLALAVQNRQLYHSLEKSFLELQKTQKTLMEQERIMAMGRMASGIAHDINNTLAPITLYTEALLEGEPGLSDRAKRFLNTIHEAARDIEGTTLRLRQFYRKTEEDEARRQIIDFPLMVEQLVELTHPRWRDIPQCNGITIKMETHVEADLPPFEGIESELREALINLVFNAVDALPEGGSSGFRWKRAMIS